MSKYTNRQLALVLAYKYNNGKNADALYDWLEGKTTDIKANQSASLSDTWDVNESKLQSWIMSSSETLKAFNRYVCENCKGQGCETCQSRGFIWK
jgi:DnaJ-class molecular chaperone